MPTKRCCCIKCVIFEDDFNRAELGSDYVGDGEIIDNVLHANNDTITICQAYELGAFYSRVTMKDTTDGAVYKVRCGDPDGGYLVTITFAGTVGIGTGTMQFSISTDDGATEAEGFTYDWEYEDELLYICYAPGSQISAGPQTRTSGSGGGNPTWVTACIPLSPHDNCWPGPKGNYTFVEGEFDDFYYTYHWVENKRCQKCDCFCWDGEAHCVPKLLYVTLGGSGQCFNGTYEMYQAATLTTDLIVPPTFVDVPQKFEWVSEPIYCPYADNAFTLTLRCELTNEDTYPRFRLELRKYGDNAICASLGFDLDDPDTDDVTRQPEDYTSYAHSKDTSTCVPFLLNFPQIVDGPFSCSEPEYSCCGGFINSGETSPQPLKYFDVTITE